MAKVIGIDLGTTNSVVAVVEGVAASGAAVVRASASNKPGLAISRKVASPHAVATGLPDSVPAWYTGPSGAICSITRRRPPNAPTITTRLAPRDSASLSASSQRPSPRRA